MSYDISALGNALVDTQFMVDYEFLQEFNLEANSMVLVSAKDQEPILKKLKALNSESVSDCGGSATNSLVAASNYGSKCHHVCRVADDDDGNMSSGRSGSPSLSRSASAGGGSSDATPAHPSEKDLVLQLNDCKSVRDVNALYTRLYPSKGLTISDEHKQLFANRKEELK